ncbi:ABC transporter permease [Stetteria hydrogenophila]
MASLGRLVVVKLTNAVVTLFVALFLISLIFSVFAQSTLKSRADEEAMMACRQMERLYTNPEEYEEACQALREQLYARYGLYDSVLERTIKLMKMNLKMDFGKARERYLGGTYDIKEQLIIALKNTIILFTTAQVIVSIIGILLGFAMARRPGSLLDRSLSLIAMITYSLPMWWVGLLMILIFSFYIPIFPAEAKEVYSAAAQVRSQFLNSFPYASMSGLSGLEIVKAALHNMKTSITMTLSVVRVWMYYMALPLMTVVLVAFGGWAYIARNLVISTLQEDFVITARAKGLPERRVLYGHVLRTASPPIVTYLALGLVGSFGGAIITETVFGWPGMGLLYWQAIQGSDTALVVAITYVSVLLFVTVILILDFLYVLLDPRVRL